MNTEINFDHYRQSEPEIDTCAEPLETAPVHSINVPYACSNDSCAKRNDFLQVPRCIVDDDGRIQTLFRHRDLDGFYVSPGGFVYCSRACWADYCD